MNVNRTTLIIWSLAITTITACPARGERLLDQGLGRMAAEIKKYLDEERLGKEMIVGSFSAPPRLKSSGGVEISRSIVARLKAVGIEVSEDADLQLMGKFRVREKQQFAGDEFDSLALEIQATILDGDDEELVEIEFDVFGSVTLQIAGINAEVPPSAPPEVREKETVRQFRKPQTELTEHTVRPVDGSKYGVEVLVNNANRLESRRPRLDSRGRAFVDLHRGEEYVVRLRNDSEIEVAVELTIDGVTAFALADDPGRRNSLFLVGPHSTATIPGWVGTEEGSNAFQIGGYADSVSKRVGGSISDVGTIGAKFRASWKRGTPRPADEPGTDDANSRDGVPPGKATVVGREIRKNYTQVQREFGVVRAVVNVRYDKENAE